MNLVLANIDYKTHTTNEGEELQAGLEHAGWKLAGMGYGENETNVPRLLDKFKPEIVFVQDKRDFDPHNAGAFRKDVGFKELGALAQYPGVKVCVVKDAGSMVQYHREFCEEINANAVVNYYHGISVTRPNCSPWLSGYPLIRTYHSVDKDTLLGLDLHAPRKQVVVSGAVSTAYPLRQRVVHCAECLGCDVICHPGYSNRMNHTPGYLRQLAGYRVHIATASAYGFALRKIIESVAVGATPVTDLPHYDELPWIDGALVRIKPNATLAEIMAAVECADDLWNLERRLEWAAIAREKYDWRIIGDRLSTLIHNEAGL